MLKCGPKDVQKGRTLGDRALRARWQLIAEGAVFVDLNRYVNAPGGRVPPEFRTNRLRGSSHRFPTSLRSPIDG